MNWGMPLTRYPNMQSSERKSMDSAIARLFMIQWSFNILSGSCIIRQSSLNGPAASKLMVRGKSVLSTVLQTQPILGFPRSWLKIGCSKQRPKTLRQISPRKLQAVISSHPTRYFGGSSCTWHILLETPKGVKKCEEGTNTLGMAKKMKAIE